MNTDLDPASELDIYYTLLSLNPPTDTAGGKVLLRVIKSVELRYVGEQKHKQNTQTMKQKIVELSKVFGIITTIASVLATTIIAVIQNL